MCFLRAPNGSYWYPFRNRSTQTRSQTQQTSPRGSNISLFKTSLREEPWNTTHQQPRRVLQEALHVAMSGKSWLGSREKIFYLEDPGGARARGIYRPYYYASAPITLSVVSSKNISLSFEGDNTARASPFNSISKLMTIALQFVTSFVSEKRAAYSILRRFFMLTLIFDIKRHD